MISSFLPHGSNSNMKSIYCIPHLSFTCDIICVCVGCVSSTLSKTTEMCHEIDSRRLVRRDGMGVEWNGFTVWRFFSAANAVDGWCREDVDIAGAIRGNWDGVRTSTSKDRSFF